MSTEVRAALIGAGASLAGVVVTLLVTGVIQAISKRNGEKLRTLRELQGIRIKIHQDVITHSEALIHMANHVARVKFYNKNSNLKEPVPGLNLKQGERWSLKAEKWVENITNDRAELHRILSDASVFFRKDPIIQTAINDFLSSPRTIELQGEPDEGANLDEIQAWDERHIKELKQLANDLYSDPLAHIINLVQKRIK